MVQWLRLHAPSEGGLGSNPGLGTRSQMPRIRPSAAIINKLKKKKKKPNVGRRNP